MKALEESRAGGGRGKGEDGRRAGDEVEEEEGKTEVEEIKPKANHTTLLQYLHSSSEHPYQTKTLIPPSASRRKQAELRLEIAAELRA